MSISSVTLYSVEVTEDIASKMRILAETGVFALKGGSCEIHMDIEGNISQVVTHVHHKVNKKLSTNKPINELSMKVL